MSTIDTTTAAQQAGGAAAQADKTGQASGFGLDKDAFLKILVAQLKNQNPSEPGDSQQYVQQMTQYSILEQLANLNTSARKQSDDAATDKAVGLIGRTVSWLGAGGTQLSGIVDKVELTDDGPTLTVGGHTGISPAELVEVR
jgi:flagellar basal-body rod modification protein FlgD